MKTEIWKDIADYEGQYMVSNLGRVKSLKLGKERILKTGKDKDGYSTVGLHKNRKQKLCKVHRLVAQAFIPNPDNLPQINHRDEDKTNNAVDNLEYCDCKYNNNYGTRIEKIKKIFGKPVLCVETGIIYQSTQEVQRRFGYSQWHIWDCCSGRRKTAYGYHWQYVEKKKEVV